MPFPKALFKLGESAAGNRAAALNGQVLKLIAQDRADS